MKHFLCQAWFNLTRCTQITWTGWWIPNNYLFRMINMDSHPCGLSSICGWYRLEWAWSPEVLHCVLNSHDCNLARMTSAALCQKNSGGLKVCWEHVVKCTLNWNNLEMRKLTHYLFRKAKRSTKEIKLGCVSEAIGHTPVRAEQRDITTHNTFTPWSCLITDIIWVWGGAPYSMKHMWPDRI